MSRYETSDYRLAGFLESRGVQFVGTRRDGRRTFFIFEGDESETERLIDDFPRSPERSYDGSCKAMHALATVRRPRGDAP